MDSDGLTIKNTGGLPYGGIKLEETKLFYQFRNYYRTTFPNKKYPGDLSFNILLWRFLRKNKEVVDHIFIFSVYNFLEKEKKLYSYLDFDLKIYYDGWFPGGVESPKGKRRRRVVFFNQLKKIWNENSAMPITDYEFDECINENLARDKNFNLEDYLKHINSNKTMNEKQVWNELFPNSNLNEEEKKRIYDYFRKMYPGDDFYDFIKNFSNINQNYDWKKFIRVFLPPVKKHSSNSFPLSLQST